MKKLITTSAVCALVALIAGATSTQAATVGVDLASSYIFRGVTLNDSFVAQPYVEASKGGLTIGAWANADLDDSDDGSVEGGHVSEVDLYASYAIPEDLDGVDLSVGFTEYTYPGAEGDADREVNLVASFDAPLAPSLGFYYGLDGAIDKALYIEGSVGHDVALNEDIAVSLGATLGYVSPDEGNDGLAHATISAGLPITDSLSASVAYVIETDDEVLMVGEEFVGSLGYSAEF